MRSHWVRSAALALALICLPIAAQAQDAGPEEVGPEASDQQAVPWIALHDGAFFPTGEDPLGTIGFGVLDERSGAPFWTTFARLGGHAALGAPISRPFGLPDARQYQVFEHAVLRWTPGAEYAEIAETMDLLWATGREPWLLERGLPASHAAGIEADVLTRMSWLTDDAIRDVFFGARYPGVPDGLAAALTWFGLPASPPAQSGGALVQRFDRALLVRDLTTGAVTTLPVGTLLSESGLLPTSVLAPDRLIGGLLVLRAPRPVLTWPHARGWGVAEPVPITAPVPSPPSTVTPAPPTQTPAATSTVPAPTPTTRAPTPTPSARPSTSQATATAPAAAAPQPGALLVVKAVVNQGRAEHVMIGNDGSVAQELTGWSIRSGAGGQQLAFPAGFVLNAGAAVRVHSGTGASAQHRPPTDLFGTGSNIWNNTGDTAILQDPTGRVVHQLTYAG